MVPYCVWKKVQVPTGVWSPALPHSPACWQHALLISPPHHSASAPVALLFWEQATMLIPGALHFCPGHSLVRDQMGSSSSCCSNERFYAVRNITPSAAVMLPSSRLLSAGGAARTSDHLLCCLFTCLLSSLDWTLYKNMAGFCLLPSLQLLKPCLAHAQSACQRKEWYWHY